MENATSPATIKNAATRIENGMRKNVQFRCSRDVVQEAEPYFEMV